MGWFRVLIVNQFIQDNRRHCRFNYYTKSTVHPDPPSIYSRMDSADCSLNDPNELINGAVKEPITWICIQRPGRQEIVWACVRFDHLRLGPLPGYLDVGTAWCYYKNLRKLEDGRCAMTHARVVSE